MRYLLDTSIFSQPLRRKPVENALIRWREVGDGQCAVSVVTVSEVEWGLHLEGREARWQKYRDLLEGRLVLLETGEEIWHRFARIKARQQQLGKVVADLDLLIAATATEEGLTVATLNAGDFGRIEGIAWEDWSQ